MKSDSVNTDWLTRPVIMQYLLIRLTCDMGEPNKAEQAYLSLADSYFENAIAGLSSVGYSNRRIKIFEDASWFYNTINNGKVIRSETISRTLLEIKQQRKRLELLIKNPEKFQENGDSKELTQFVTRLLVVFNESNLS